MKIVFKSLIFLIILGVMAFMFFGCNNKDTVNTEENGTDISRIIEEFPKIKGIVSCNWTYKNVSNDSRLAVGPSVYALYGEIVLSNEYYDEILSEYTWEELKSKTLIAFIDEIINRKNVYINELFAKEMSNKTFVKFLLEKETKTLYFYQEY